MMKITHLLLLAFVALALVAGSAEALRFRRFKRAFRRIFRPTGGRTGARRRAEIRRPEVRRPEVRRPTPKTTTRKPTNPLAPKTTCSPATCRSYAKRLCAIHRVGEARKKCEHFRYNNCWSFGHCNVKAVIAKKCWSMRSQRCDTLCRRTPKTVCATRCVTNKVCRNCRQEAGQRCGWGVTSRQTACRNRFIASCNGGGGGNCRQMAGQRCGWGVTSRQTACRNRFIAQCNQPRCRNVRTCRRFCRASWQRACKRECHSYSGVCHRDAKRICAKHVVAHHRTECVARHTRRCLGKTTCDYVPAKESCKKLSHGFCSKLSNDQCTHHRVAHGRESCKKRRYEACRATDSCRYRRLKNICYKVQASFCASSASKHCNIHVVPHVKLACISRVLKQCKKSDTCKYVDTKKAQNVKCRKLTHKFCRKLSRTNCRHQLVAHGRRKCVRRRYAHCRKIDSCTYRRLRNICYKVGEKFCFKNADKLCSIHVVDHVQDACIDRVVKQCGNSNTCKYVATRKGQDVRCRTLSDDFCHKISKANCAHQKTSYGIERCRQRRFKNCKRIGSCKYRRLANKCWKNPSKWCADRAAHHCRIHKVGYIRRRCEKRIIATCASSNTCKFLDLPQHLGVKCRKIDQSHCAYKAKKACHRNHVTSEGRQQCFERRMSHCTKSTSCTYSELKKQCFPNSDKMCNLVALRRCSVHLNAAARRRCAAAIVATCKKHTSCSLYEPKEEAKLLKDPPLVPCIVKQRPPAGTFTFDVQVNAPWDHFDCDQWADYIRNFLQMDADHLFISGVSRRNGQTWITVACPNDARATLNKFASQLEKGNASITGGKNGQLGISRMALGDTNVSAPSPLSVGAIVGIAVGGAAALALVAVAIALIVKKAQANAAAQETVPLAEQAI